MTEKFRDYNVNPRAFSVATKTNGEMKEINYGTPIIDGILDEACRS